MPLSVATLPQIVYNYSMSMKQHAYTMDSVSVQKSLKGLAISAGGALLAGFVLLVPEVSDYLASGDPVEWRQAAVAIWGAFATAIINTAREFVKGA